MIAVIDNYDSFTYNLVQLLGELGCNTRVFRNDAITPRQLVNGEFTGLVVSPGPGTPNDAGVSCAAIRAAAGVIPVLGVCLGHQCIGAVFGGQVTRAPQLMHGKASAVHHCSTGLFEGVPNPFSAARYHSLIVSHNNLPECLTITAQTSDGIIMGLRHKQYSIEGLQFHPESILTEHGRRILANFASRTGVGSTHMSAPVACGATCDFRGRLSPC